MNSTLEVALGWALVGTVVACILDPRPDMGFRRFVFTCLLWPLVGAWRLYQWWSWRRVLAEAKRSRKAAEASTKVRR